VGQTQPFRPQEELAIATFQLLITEVTNFGDLRCVAGWDLDRQKMIRPEPHRAGFWAANQIAPAGKFEVGKIVSFVGTKPHPATDYPHLTEDRVVTSGIAGGPVLGTGRKKRVLHEAAFDSLDEIFDGKLVVDGQKAYVPVGTQCRSLGGLIVPAKGASIESYHNYEGKERLRLRFRDGTTYLAPNMTSTKAYAEHAAGRLDEVNARIAKADHLILRIGLARGFPAVPDRCYLQVMGYPRSNAESPMSFNLSVFTIGHSNHSWGHFQQLLQSHGVTGVADVRSAPYSRHSLHFDRDDLKSSLRKIEIVYSFLGGELGGRPRNSNLYCEGVADYERISETSDFKTGIGRVIEGAQNYRLALLCSEHDPLTCHRCLLVARRLAEESVEVKHILADGALVSQEALEDRLLKNLGSEEGHRCAFA
jgi:hypothetical protein